MLQTRLEHEVGRGPEDEVDLLRVGGARPVDVEQRRRNDVRRRRRSGKSRIGGGFRFPGFSSLGSGVVGLVDGSSCVVGTKSALDVLKNLVQDILAKNIIGPNWENYWSKAIDQKDSQNSRYLSKVKHISRNILVELCMHFVPQHIHRKS